jgi:hypothetical protein
MVILSLVCRRPKYSLDLKCAKQTTADGSDSLSVYNLYTQDLKKNIAVGKDVGGSVSAA